MGKQGLVGSEPIPWCCVWARKRPGSKHSVMSFEQMWTWRGSCIPFVRKHSAREQLGIERAQPDLPLKSPQGWDLYRVLSSPERGLKAGGSAWMLGGDLSPPVHSALDSVGISLGSSPLLQAEQAPGPRSGLRAGGVSGVLSWDTPSLKLHPWDGLWNEAAALGK